MTRPIRVLLADSSPLQRAGLRAVLTTPGDALTRLRPAHTSESQTPGRMTATAPDGRLPEHRADGAEPASVSTDPDSGMPGWTGGGPAEIIVAGEAGDGVEAVDLARRLLPDVLITDVLLPRSDGLAVARSIAAARLEVRVLVLTDSDSDEEVVAAVAAGATGYLCKDAPRGELAAAVRAIAAGGAVITPMVLARVLSRIIGSLPSVAAESGASRLAPLTSREREVLVHVARGHSNAEIAETFGVSETTVKTHVGHVLTKLRLRDRTQAVVLAYEVGLVRPRS